GTRVASSSCRRPAPAAAPRRADRPPAPTQGRRSRAISCARWSLNVPPPSCSRGCQRFDAHFLTCWVERPGRRPSVAQGYPFAPPYSNAGFSAFGLVGGPIRRGTHSTLLAAAANAACFVCWTIFPGTAHGCPGFLLRVTSRLHDTACGAQELGTGDA